MKRIVMVIAFILCMSSVVWGEPKIKITKADDFSLTAIKKVLVLPVWHAVKSPYSYEKSEGYYKLEYSELVKDAFRAAAPKNTTIVIKTLKEIWGDVLMNAIGSSTPINYDINKNETMTEEAVKDFLTRAFALVDMVVSASAEIDLSDYHVQGFSIPYSTYNYSNIIGNNGAIIGQLQTPQYHSINIPGHTETQFTCICYINLINTKHSDDAFLKASYYNTKRYQGGDLDEAIKSAFTATLKKAFSNKK